LRRGRYADQYGDGNTDPNKYAHANGYTNKYTDGNPDQYADGNTNAHKYTYGDTNQ
jgi:hypothetical protein